MTRRTVRATLGAAALILAQLAIPLAAEPAWALPGLTIVQDFGPINSANKSLAVPCPNELVVIGGGAKVTGAGQSYVHLGTLQPQEATNSFGVVAWEVEPGTNLTWQMNVFAVCIQRPPVLHYVYEDTNGDRSSESGQTLTVWCPANTTVIGMGAYVSGAGQVLLQGMYPAASDAVTAWAHEDWNGYANTWGLGVWAVCADVNAVTDTRTTAQDHVNPKAATVGCTTLVYPYVHGVGFNSNGAPGRLLLTDLLLSFDHKQAVAAVEEDPLGTNLDWSMTTHAICAP